MDKLRVDREQVQSRRRVASGQVVCGILTCLLGICVVSIPNQVDSVDGTIPNHWWAANTGVGIWIGLYVILNGGIGIVNANFAYLGRSAMLMNYCALLFTTMSLFLSTLAAKESAICWLNDDVDSCQFSDTLLSSDYAQKQMFVNSFLVFFGVISVILSITNSVSLSRRYCHCLQGETEKRLDVKNLPIAVITFSEEQPK